jgi:peptidoglycan hydrolase-like protein with peptidoglycan-binding domain
MSRLRTPRWAALATVVAVLAVSGAAYGLTRVGGTSVVAPATTTTTVPRTTTTEAAPTTTTTATTLAPTTTVTGPAPDDGVLERGERGPEVEALQRKLAELHFDAGVPDGAYGIATLYAVQGFQKLAGMAPDGKVGPEVQAALANPPFPSPMVPNGAPTRVEVDLQRQLLFLYVDGNLDLITHVSTGSGEEYCVERDCGNKAITPEGGFRFMWRYKGWRESRLGKLYNPVYFTRSGVAIHGSTSVPTYPASHGCVRIPMHIAEWFPSRVRSGDEVYVLAHAGAPAGAPPPPSPPPGPPPDDPPSSPDTTEAPPESTTSTTEPSPDDPTTTTTASTIPVP